MTTPDPAPSLRVLVTGATGYVGSRLVPRLLEEGHTALAASRDTSGTDDYPWADDVETRAFDVEDDDLVGRAVEGVDVVVYLVHSMGSEDFVRKDREAAERVAAAAARAGVRQVVYLSGLVPSTDPDELSDHLRSRLEVEQVFLDGDVPAVVLRASMVIGAGSTSYELLRRLSERVPLLTPVPSWMRSTIQPVAVEDVVEVVAGALRSAAAGQTRNRHYDVGGEERLTYPELLATYAEVAGLRRARFLVPWVPQKVVGWACSAISGLPATEVTSLVDSLRLDMVCEEDDVRRDLLPPDHELVPVAEALRRSRRGGSAPGTATRGDVQAGAPTDPA
ncbi:NAD(P)H-binding protein [Nocardioides litoris]|uniref:NAD(P)H-binding protein n=1 Tax=Nocardioides litoris TaxID=1926648 RepID=UPI001123C4E2|nr:NAD(P)H-binding protein [Nocardioides litoris]